MATTEFSTGTLIESTWLNDVNDTTYNKRFADGTIALSAQPGSLLDASDVSYTPSGTDAEVTTIENQLRFIQGQIVNVKNAPFYAIGDGVVDDYPAIQAAIDYVESFDLEVRPTIFVPSGNYLITSPIVILTDGMRLIGAGNAAPFNGLSVYSGGTKFTYGGSSLATATQGVFMFGSSVDQCRGLRLDSFTIDAADLGNAIWGEQLNGSEISRITTLHSRTGIYLTGSNNNSNTIESCLFYDPTNGGGGIDLRSNAHSNDILKCQFGNKTTGTRNPAFAVRIAADENCSAVNVIGNNFDYYRTTRHVHVVTDCKAFSFTGNYIEAKGDGVTANLLSLDGGSGINIAGNRFSKSDSPTVTAIDYGVNIGANAEDIIIVGNYFSGMDTACIRLGSGATNLTTGGNSCNGITEVNDQNTVGSTVKINSGNIMARSISARKLSVGAPTTYVVASGAITIGDTSFISVDTEASAASDDLDTISGATEDGQLLIIQTLNTSRDVTVKDAIGNIQLASDFVHLTGRDKLTLIWVASASFWHELSRTTN